jgi:hypothetical protein
VIESSHPIVAPVVVNLIVIAGRSRLPAGEIYGEGEDSEEELIRR